MSIKQHIGVDIKFEDVPDECKIYTYLYSQAIVLHYNDDKCTIWDEYDIVRLVFPVHLDADKEKLIECCELFARYIQDIKFEKLDGQIEGIMRNYTILRPIFIDDSGEE